MQSTFSFFPNCQNPQGELDRYRWCEPSHLQFAWAFLVTHEMLSGKARARFANQRKGKGIDDASF